MTIQASIIVPLVLIIIFTSLAGIAFMTAEVFYQHEDGAGFLLAVHEGSNLNGYMGKPSLVKEDRGIYGIKYTADDRSNEQRQFKIIKKNRYFLGLLDKALGK